jgi:TPR repeat protein
MLANPVPNSDRLPMDVISRKHWNALQSAADSGDDNAQWELGYYFQHGAQDKSKRTIVIRSAETAIKWYQASALQGNRYAQNSLGVIFSSGGEIPEDFASAIYWSKLAIAQDDSTAAFNLATIYRDMGKPRLAFRWYQKSAAMGDKDASLQIGLCYLFGFGTRQDFASAILSFERVITCDPSTCCQRSIDNARYWLAVLQLIRGLTTKGKLARVRSLLEIANAGNDHEQAHEILHLIGSTRRQKAPLDS